MKLTILGASPSFQNAGGSSSSYLIEGGGSTLVVDCGHGSTGILRDSVDLAEIDAIVVSHMHPDHYFDLVPLTYALQFLYADLPAFPLFLPPGGTALLTGLVTAIDLAPDFFARRYRLCEYDSAVPLHVGEVSIRFAPTSHFVAGNAMRFSTRGETGEIAYTSDTGWTQPVVDLLNGADLAIIEAAQLVYERPDDSAGHLTADLSGRMARIAGVKRLVLTHFNRGHAGETLRMAAEEFSGPIDLATERMTFEV